MLKPKLTKPADVVTGIGVLLAAYEGARTFMIVGPAQYFERLALDHLWRTAYLDGCA